MNYLLFGVTGVLGLLSFFYIFAKWKHSYWTKKGIPQLEPDLFYGDARGMITGEKSIAETYLEYYKKFKDMGVGYGGTYAVFRKIFIPIEPELIKDIMQKNFDHFTGRFIMPNNSVFSKGLFHLGGESWRRTRKQLTPTFTSGKMKMMFETLMEKTTGLESLVEEFSKTGGPVDIKDILSRFTSDVIGSCGFGIDCNALRDPNSEFLKHGRFILAPPKTKENYWGLFLRVLGIRRLRKNFKPSENFFKRIVGETIDYREKNDIYRKDFMHLMIQLKNRGSVSDDEKIFGSNKDGKANIKNFIVDEDYITAQCLIFFLAGYETSATTMTFALLELAQDREMQNKVRREVNEVLQKHNGKITYDAMLELTYTERVISETLRKYPPLAMIPRVCSKDYTIPRTDIIIEKGTVTHIPTWGLHMDPDYFPNPEKFDPERFSEENKANMKDFTYIPFGEGPRLCLGMRFGMMQSKVGLASLVRNYKFTLNEKTSLPLKMQRDTLITTVDGTILVDITKV